MARDGGMIAAMLRCLARCLAASIRILPGLLAFLAAVVMQGAQATESPGPRFATEVARQPAAAAEPVIARLRAGQPLRVCIWPAYYGITWRNPRNQQLVGLDIDLSRRFAEQLGVDLVHVESSFASLIEDVLGERCDIAMFAIAVLPQRAKHLAFSQPYLRSGIYGVTTRSSRVVRDWSDIDRPGVVVAVQAGTFMEPVMAESLRRARLRVIRPPLSRERELEAGRIDVFMTDYPYSRRLLDNADWARLVAPPQPFHVLPYAYAVKPGDEAWLQTLNRFVASVQQDGRLAAAARRHGLTDIVVLK